MDSRKTERSTKISDSIAGNLKQRNRRKTGSSINSSSLARELELPSKKMSGLAALKTHYRPFICPLDLVLSQIPEGARLYWLWFWSITLSCFKVTLSRSCTWI